MPGVHHAVGEFSVVRHQQQAFGVEVQTAHRINPDAAVGHKLAHGASALLVGHGGDEAPGLMEHQIDVLRRLWQPDAVHLDDVLIGIGPLAQSRRIAVQTHPALADQLFRFPAGYALSGRYDFLDPFLHCSLPSFAPPADTSPAPGRRTKMPPVRRRA